MFQPKKPSRTRAKPLLASALVHGLVLYVLYAPPAFLDRHPSAAMLGQNGDSVELVYLSQLGLASATPETAQVEAEKMPAFVFPRAAEEKPKRRRPRKKPAANTVVESARAGSPRGSLLNGPLFGHDVRPALPIQSVNPDFRSLNVPAGVRGNIVARVRIDAEGKVVDVLLVTGLGHGIDEQVLEALLLWRYQPATLDGTPVPEQHLVVFPFPR